MYSLTLTELQYVRSLIPNTELNSELNRKLDVEIEYLDSLLQPEREYVVRYNEMKQRVFECCEKVFGVEKQQLCSKSKEQFLSDIRHAIIVLFRENGFSCNESAAVVDRNHCLAIYATKIHESMLNYSSYKNAYNTIKNAIEYGN